MIELCFFVKVTLKNNKYHDFIVRTGAFSIGYGKEICVEHDFHNLVQALQDEIVTFKIREWNNKTSIFYLDGDKVTKEVIDKWRKKYNVLPESEIFFIDD